MSDDLTTFRENSIRALLAEQLPAGTWEGELSSSALSTATSIVALSLVDSKEHQHLIESGVEWLEAHQNDDGGWGDTIISASNISTTLLCWSAIQFLRSADRKSVNKANFWIRDYVGSLNPDHIAEAVKARYGKDRTFSVPILMFCAICNTLGENGWRRVLPLPYELAAVPRKWYAIMQLPVVSYALPALIAIGRARFIKVSPWPVNPLYWIRLASWKKVSKLLHHIQPESGGYLEAAPLTGFVTMALASIDAMDHPAVINGVRFLTNNVRQDGSWPIDTNLATWATTLAVKGLEAHPPNAAQHQTSDYDRSKILKWLLAQQYKEVHPFTNSAPGGWAWTDLSGGVPDADDTPGALLAIYTLTVKDSREQHKILPTVTAGTTWLLDLQNRDGGIPTFCKGWGALPFDRSSPDLTAHTIRAWIAWYDFLDSAQQKRIRKGINRAIEFLSQQQQRDGSWVPLWFGNQHLTRNEENPTYGTAMVCRALEEIISFKGLDNQLNRSVPELLKSGMKWLAENQNPDGGWGAGTGTKSSIEETSIAVSALAFHQLTYQQNINRGVDYLKDKTCNGTIFPSAPIGFYFAKLWYFEKIYPLVWCTEALNRLND